MMSLTGSTLHTWGLTMDENILEEALRITTGDRNESYGHPIEDFTKITGMINAAFQHKLKEPLVAEDWPLIMQFVKISRQINSPARDNVVDGAGYWNTLAMVQDERERRREAESAPNQIWARALEPASCG